MGKVVELTIPTEQFALSETFKTVPDATAETVPVAAHSDRGSMPFLSVVSSERDHLTDAIQSDETTEEVVPLSGSNARQLYQISWRAPVRVVLGLPLVLFLSGYAFIAALTPEPGPVLIPRLPSRPNVAIGGSTESSGSPCRSASRSRSSR
jgi:hypothetical protein